MVTATVKLVGKTVEAIEGALADTVPGADGLIFLPFLNGERTPDLSKRARHAQRLVSHQLYPLTPDSSRRGRSQLRYPERA